MEDNKMTIYVIFKITDTGKVIGMRSFKAYEDAKAYAAFLRRRSQEHEQVIFEESPFDE